MLSVKGLQLRGFNTTATLYMDNIKTGLKEIGCETVHWIYVAQYRDQWQGLVKTVMNIRVHKTVSNLLTVWATKKTKD
jgi:hypothetical protein